jgi:colanic acid/amylovoran biosynthesis glycosyltransferase
MAVGLPVLTTGVGGNPEIVDEGRTGRLVESMNPDAIANGLIAMCRDRARWPELGRNGRRRVEEKFEIRGMIRQYEQLYSELLSTHRPAEELQAWDTSSFNDSGSRPSDP